MDDHTMVTLIPLGYESTGETLGRVKGRWSGKTRAYSIKHPKNLYAPSTHSVCDGSAIFYTSN
jgi:hypothetical protein